MQVAIGFGILFLVYFYFWFHSFHPAMVARVYDLDSGEEEHGLVANTSITWWNPASLAWTAILVALLALTPGRCSFANTETGVEATLLTLMTAIISWKIFLAPAGTVFKSYYRKQDGSLVETFSLKIFDFVTGYATTFGEVLFWKLTMVGFFTALTWLVGWTSESPIPIGLFLAWVISEFGRSASFLQPGAGTGAQRLRFLIVFLVSMAIMWALVEKLLIDCGAGASQMPTASQLLGGLLALPLVEFTFFLVGTTLLAILSSLNPR